MSILKNAGFPLKSRRIRSFSSLKFRHAPGGEIPLPVRNPGDVYGRAVALHDRERLRTASVIDEMHHKAVSLPEHAAADLGRSGDVESVLQNPADACKNGVAVRRIANDLLPVNVLLNAVQLLNRNHPGTGEWISFPVAVPFIVISAERIPDDLTALSNEVENLPNFTVADAALSGENENTAAVKPLQTRTVAEDEAERDMIAQQQLFP